jgi:uncharacterized BrkB/YihY/UPF0761 family membrane protein
VRGPWHLGRGSAVIGWLAVAWVIVILFPLLGPQFYPFSIDSSGHRHFLINAANWAPLVFIVVIGFAGIYWAVSAKNWFKGPVVQGSAEELAAIEHDLTL